jgi:HPr kinase/phosphorylase
MRHEAAVVETPNDLSRRSAGTAGAADRIRLHASCVAVDGCGVLISGPSGSGKSDLALRLIDGGAVLVADDQVSVERTADALIARPVHALEGLLEVRGYGIVRLPHQGVCRLCLAVELDVFERIPRLPEPLGRPLLGLELACLRVDPRAPSAAAVVRLALAAERVEPAAR